MPITILSALVAVTTVAVASLLCVALIGRDRGVRWSDLPFFFFLTLTLVYTELSPTLAVAGRTLPLIEQRSGAYVRLQILLFLAFVLPLIGAYGWRRRATVSSHWPRERVRMTSKGWDVALVAVAVLRLAIAWRYDLWQLRIGDAVVEKTNATPFLTYSFFRLLVESQLPLVTVAAIRVSRSRATAARASFAFFVLVQSAFALLNSRFSILYLFVAAVFGLAIGRRPTIRIDRRVRRTVIVSLLGVYILGLAVLQLRAASNPPTSASRPLSLSVVADSQGTNRFNCADLLAQIAPFQDSPAGPGIWAGQVWNFKRFVDPVGFAAFRQTLVTSAKSQLILRYLGQRQSDYFSCMLTDGYGALGPWGALLLGLLCGLALRATAVLIESDRLALMFTGAWLAWQVLVFEQEAGSLLFSWPLRLPLLALLLFAARLMTIPDRLTRTRPTYPDPTALVGHDDVEPVR